MNTQKLLVATASLLVFVYAVACGEQSSIVPRGADWRYLDDGSDQGTAWRDLAFDDSSWSIGPAQLGYGDDDERTVVSFGPNANNKYPTTYFRHTFNVANAGQITRALMRTVRDDGVVVYLNGTTILRSNMPAGTIDYQTFAASTISSSEEDVSLPVLINQSLIQDGPNILAAEVHQRSATSSDISFDLELITTDAAAIVTRGPYLQKLTDSSVVIRWRTDTFTDSAVSYGDAPGALNQTLSDATQSLEHEFEITGLQAGTQYFYSIGTTAETLVGDDNNHSFKTHPNPTTDTPLRVWAIGDSGTADLLAQQVRDGYLDFSSGVAPDVWLMLGDNAYEDGTDAEYQSAVFEMYGDLLRQVSVWPTLGNHDARSAASATETGVYYNIFSLPRAAESGGLASGTEAYYSFDYGNVHFICLDSDDTNRAPGGAMMTWLQADLNDTLADWVIAFWHHPPYSRGSHNSDTSGTMTDMRVNALPILEAGGVDLVLTGHSHSYERSFLVDGHYGFANSLQPSMILDGGDGDESSDGPYRKPTLGQGSNEGAIYIVAGSSGKLSDGPLNHPIMIVGLEVLGSVALDISGNRLDGSFIGTSGVLDQFTILKGILPGDMNCDGTVTVSDIGGFVLALTDPTSYATQFPDCDITNGDINNDGAVTVSDIGAFVALLTNP